MSANWTMLSRMAVSAIAHSIDILDFSEISRKLLKFFLNNFFMEPSYGKLKSSKKMQYVSAHLLIYYDAQLLQWERGW